MPHREISKGEQTREAIRHAAAQAFRERGYDVATLEDIAGGLGITRSAVLHHFGSKEEILREIVDPFLQDVDRLLDKAEAAGNGPRAHRAFVTEFVDLLCERRCVASLLTRDITAHGHLGPADNIARRAERFVAVLSRDGSDRSRLKALSALGAVLRPVTALPENFPLGEPESRGVLVESALAALRA